MGRQQKTPSYLDAQLADKVQHEDLANAKRIIDIDNVVEQYWNRADVSYDGNNSATNAKFYVDNLQEITKIKTVSDTAGNLNNKYFLINSGLDKTEYYVWYNLGSTGTDPNIAGKTGIEVPIAFNEQDSVIALATKLIVGTLAGSDFEVKNFSNCIEFINKQYGDTTDASDVSTGFDVEVDRHGNSELIKDFDIPQQPGIRYVYNEVEKEFQAYNTDINIQIGKAQSPVAVNQVIVLASSEVNIALPNGTKKFYIRVRENDTDLELAYQSGGDHIFIRRGNSYSEEGLDTDNVTLYLTTNVGNRTVELVYWT